VVTILLGIVTLKTGKTEFPQRSGHFTAVTMPKSIVTDPLKPLGKSSITSRAEK
jgi:hypothetical protein